MRKLKKLILTITFLFIFLTSACSPNRNGCTLPPEDFERTDLVGTWVAGWSERNDTLILRENGTYKQIVHINHHNIPDVGYESDWLPWHLEYAENGIPYLHLEGMRLCGYVPDLIDCEQVGGGEEDWDAFNQNYWHDFCRDEFILMPDGGILMVLGVPEDPKLSSPPRGINLWLPLISPESPWAYTLQEP